MSLHLAFQPPTSPILVSVDILVQLLARVSELHPVPRTGIGLTEINKACWPDG
jgi:hypothetical protein